jgi:hypothetical protein
VANVVGPMSKSSPPGRSGTSDTESAPAPSEYHGHRTTGRSPSSIGWPSPGARPAAGCRQATRAGRLIRSLVSRRARRSARSARRRTTPGGQPRRARARRPSAAGVDQPVAGSQRAAYADANTGQRRYGPPRASSRRSAPRYGRPDPLGLLPAGRDAARQAGDRDREHEQQDRSACGAGRRHSRAAANDRRRCAMPTPVGGTRAAPYGRGGEYADDRRDDLRRSMSARCRPESEVRWRSWLRSSATTISASRRPLPTPPAGPRALLLLSRRCRCGARPAARAPPRAERSAYRDHHPSGADSRRGQRRERMPWSHPPVGQPQECRAERCAHQRQGTTSSSPAASRAIERRPPRARTRASSPGAAR